jgi:hypothetical protein
MRLPSCSFAGINIMITKIYRFTANKEQCCQGKEYKRGKQEVMKSYSNPVQHTGITIYRSERLQ